MANVITISDGQTHVVSTAVEANYVVTDGTLQVAAGGVITGDTGTFGVPATVQVQRGGVLNVTGGTITSQPASNTFLGPVAVSGGSATVSSGAVTGNGGTAAIVMNGAQSSLTISGGTITAPQGGVAGGSGILLIGQDGQNTLTVTGGTITGGSGSTAGGAGLTMVQSTSNGSNRATINGGTFAGGSGGTAAGPGIVVDDEGTLTVNGGTIGTAAGGAMVLNQQKSGVLFDIAITGGIIVGGTSFTPAMNMSVPQSAVGMTVTGGTFSGSWTLNSGIAVVQGMNLAVANNVLTGTLAHGQAIDVRVTLQRTAQLDLQTVTVE